jgi:hypothetical protein
MPDEPRDLLPMQIQVGDRFVDESVEWEIVTHPAVSHGGKALHARAQRPGDPASARDMLWPAHDRMAILRRAPTTEPTALTLRRRPGAKLPSGRRT